MTLTFETDPDSAKSDQACRISRSNVIYFETQSFCTFETIFTARAMLALQALY